MIRSIDAVTLSVSDMDASVDFYASLGFLLERGGKGWSFTTFRVGAQALNLAESGDVDATGWGRVILHVDDVDEMHRLALENGLTPEAAPRDAPWGERYFHLDDPDGHQLSFAKRL